MITTVHATVTSLIETKSGKKKDGGEWEKKTFLVEAVDAIGKTRPLVVTFMSGDGPVINIPEVGKKINLTLSIYATQYNGRWFNNVQALHFDVL